MPATVLEFARVNDAAASVPGKLLKQAALAEFFRSLDQTDLRLAVRFAAGRSFARTDERVLSVGGAIVSDIAMSLLGLDSQHFHALIVRKGEMGEALAAAWPAQAAPTQSTLTLRDVADAFDRLAATGVVESKRIILLDLFGRCASPREAAYLAKIIFGDLRTGVQEGVLQAAVAQAFDKRLAEIHRCHLLVGDLEEVAVLAAQNLLESARFRLFHPVQFMLATPQETPAQAAATLGGRAYFCEDKLDGIRAQVHKSGDRVVIYTRTMDRTDESFPDVVAAMIHLSGEFLLDGEIVPYRDGCVLPFAHIQRRLGRKVLTPRMLAQNPAAFVAFDILYRDGNLLMDCPLQQRRASLDHLATKSSLLTTKVIEVATADAIEREFDAARTRRNEGLILKDPQSIYSPGRRGQAWLKLKTHLPTFDCVVTAAEYGHGKRRDVLSDYTFAVWDRPLSEEGARLVNVGKAYSGCTDEEIGRLTELFLELSLGQFGRTRVVKPQVVLEIACDQIQKSRRHDSGYAFRFPRIKRIRWDKLPPEADTLQRVAEVYESVSNFGRTEVQESPVEPTLFD